MSRSARLEASCVNDVTMSGPLEEPDAMRADEGPLPTITQGRSTQVGGVDVVRLLPTKGRRTVGGWCFVDLMTPSDDPDPLEVGPHPHTGLATVTWLFAGEALHSDSLGTQQPIMPGQLNLMTAGSGIAHAEVSAEAGVHGVQMWAAQPELTRHLTPRFEHLADVPAMEWPGGNACVFVGTCGGIRSPVAVDTPLVGAELELHAARSELGADPLFEHAVLPVDNPVLVEGSIVEPGWIAFVGAGRTSIRLEGGRAGGRVMLLGGTPLGEEIQMWWNFVARSKDEITQAWKAWKERDTDRFGHVPTDVERIESPVPPWITPGGAFS